MIAKIIEEYVASKMGLIIAPSMKKIKIKKLVGM